MHSWLGKWARVGLGLGGLLLGCDAPVDAPERSEKVGPVAHLDAVTQALAQSGTITSGQPIPVTAQQGFRYFEVVGAKCRDGSNAGVTVRRPAQTSRNVVVYLQGGGACFNTQTCLPPANPNNISEQHRAPSAAGIFDDSDEANPFRDWNIVYVPYCTGDFHMGNNVASVPFGPSNQLFVGRENLELILPSVVATFPATQKVLITGSSAGGAGATVSVAPIKRAFAASAPQLYLINDAGPLLSPGNSFFNDYLPTSEQARWSKLWGLSSTLLADCGAVCNTPDMLGAYAKQVQQLLGRKPALVTGKQDLVVSLLYANARLAKYPLFGLVGVQVHEALDTLRTRMAGSWSTYYVTTPDALAKQHMFLLGDNFYTVEQQVLGAATGQKRTLQSWVAQYVEGDGATLPDVGP